MQSFTTTIPSVWEPAVYTEPEKFEPDEKLAEFAASVKAASARKAKLKRRDQRKCKRHKRTGCNVPGCS